MVQAYCTTITPAVTQDVMDIIRFRSKNILFHVEIIEDGPFSYNLYLSDVGLPMSVEATTRTMV